jgi:hypothetical protein
LKVNIPPQTAGKGFRVKLGVYARVRSSQQQLSTLQRRTVVFLIHLGEGRQREAKAKHATGKTNIALDITTERMRQAMREEANSTDLEGRQEIVSKAFGVGADNAVDFIQGVL